MKRKEKHPERMTRAELSRATRPFDEPYVFEKAFLTENSCVFDT
jgi:hypothetical protein